MLISSALCKLHNRQRVPKCVILWTDYFVFSYQRLSYGVFVDTRATGDALKSLLPCSQFRAARFRPYLELNITTEYKYPQCQQNTFACA